MRYKASIAMNSRTLTDGVFYLKRLPVLLMILAFASGCLSSPPLSTWSEKKEASIRANRNGLAAYGRGNYSVALDNYLEALRLSRSIEDMDGIAVNLINLSSTYRKTGNYDSAHKYVDEIINADQGQFNEKYIAESIYIKATLFVAQDLRDSIQLLVDEGLLVCSKVSCDSEGKLYNLKAKDAFLNKNYASALIYAKKAMVFNEKQAELKETANSLRLMAKASTELEKYKDGLVFYSKALALDKKLGLSHKIEADLRGLGFLFFKQEKYDDALKYFERALSVSLSSSTENSRTEDIIDMVRRCREEIDGS